MKKSSSFLVINLILLSFLFNVSYLTTFSSAIDQNDDDPFPMVTVLDNENIFFRYNLAYMYNVGAGFVPGNFNFSMTVNGTDQLYENGTIDYHAEQNITDEVILSKLETTFSSAHINYFRNHTENETLRTHFSYRKEYFAENFTFDTADDFVGSYIIFWLNTTGKTIADFEPNSQFPFGNKLPYTNLYIKDGYITDLVYGTWDYIQPGLGIAPYQIRAPDNSINLFFDKRWTVLLFANIDYEDANSDKYFIDIGLLYPDKQANKDTYDPDKIDDIDPEEIKEQMDFRNSFIILITGVALFTFVLTETLQNPQKNKKFISKKDKKVLNQI